jgi:hypothetical protein
LEITPVLAKVATGARSKEFMLENQTLLSVKNAVNHKHHLHHRPGYRQKMTCSALKIRHRRRLLAEVLADTLESKGKKEVSKRQASEALYLPHVTHRVG